MKKILLYLTILFTGISIGIIGEFFIPDKYAMPLAQGCIKGTIQGIVFIPQMEVYSPQEKYPYPLYSEEFKLRSYELLWEFMMNRAAVLSQTDCNKLVEKILDRKEKLGY